MADPPYVELHCHTNYSMLDGASHLEELVARARELGMESLAVTDHQGLYGIVRFWQAALQEGIRPIIGAEITLEGGHHLTLLARNREGYGNLCRLISATHLRTGDWGLRTESRADSRQLSAFSFQPSALSTHLITHHSSPITNLSPQSPVLSPPLGGLICLSGCRRGEIARYLLAGSRRRARKAAERYLQLFGSEGFWIELQHHLLPEDDWLCAELAELADRLGIGCVATNNVHYATREGQRLQDILVCIKNRSNLDAAGGLLRPNSEYHLKPAREMSALFQRYPGAVANSRVIAERCQVDLNFKGYRFPGFQVPRGETPFSYLYRLCHEGTRERYRPITPTVSKQLAHELEVIHKTGLAEYFLIVWDLMRYAREKGIPGQGRGSAADSLVAYVLGITRVDPIRHNLLFERFLSEEMTGMPDIDIDFSTNHREEILQYVYRKYGQEHTGMVCNVVTYRARSALREVGKAMGLPLELLDRFAKAVNHHSTSHLEEELCGETWRRGDGARTIVGADLCVRPPHEDQGAHVGADLCVRPPHKDQGAHAGAPLQNPEPGPSLITHHSSLITPHPSPNPWQQLLDFCRQIEGFPRHLSIHVGGMLITATPLVEIAPLQPAAMPGRVVVQFNKDDVEDMGLIKMDLLGLRTLSVIHDALEMIRETRGMVLDLDLVPLDDPAVYDMLCEPDNIGVFQIESRAQSQTLPKMRPRSIEDLIVEISIIRPGPLQGNMVHPYLRRRAGKEKVTYLHPSLEPVLGETLGVVLFQEQVIRVAVAVAGFTPGEADLFRRAMNRHRSAAEMARIKARFLEGARRNGLEEDAAETIFQQLAGFASYGFCKSHAAAFAKTAYDTAYLKRYYAPEFYAAILNNQPMGFYSPEVVANDAKRHGIRILPVDVNRSRARCTVEVDGVGQGFIPCRPAPTHNGAAGACPPPYVSEEATGGFALRLGFGYVHGLGEAALKQLEDERLSGPYRSLQDFLRRIRLPHEAVEKLIAVGAMDCFGRPRRAMLWEAGVEGRGDAETRRRGDTEMGGRGDAETRRRGDTERTIVGADLCVRPPHKDQGAHAGADLCVRPPHEDQGAHAGAPLQDPEPRTQNPTPHSAPLPLVPSPAPSLPALSLYEETAIEYSLLGMSPGHHAVELFRDLLEEVGAVPCERLAGLPRNLVVKVGGLVVCEQAPPTAKGHVFLTLEDETGLANVVLRPQVYRRFRLVLHTDQMVLIEGLLQKEDGVTNLMARRISSLHQAALLATGSSKRPHRR